MNTKKWILVFIFGLISAWLILSFVRIPEVLIAFSVIYLAAKAINTSGILTRIEVTSEGDFILKQNIDMFRLYHIAAIGHREYSHINE